MNKGIIFLFLVFFLSSWGVCHAQQRKNLESDKLRIEKEIVKLNKQLEETKKNKNASANQLSLIKKRIQEREKLISTINSQVNALSSQIDSTQKNISQLHSRIDSLKIEYANIIRMLYRQRGLNNTLTFVFDAQNFNQAFLRMKFFKDYSSYSHIQAKEILEKEKELMAVNQVLEKQKTSQVQLLSQEQQQKERLATEQKQTQKSLAKIQQDEKKLTDLRNQKQKEALALQKKIQAMIAEEVRKKQEEARKAREKAAKEAKEAKKAGTPAPASTVKPKENYTMAVTPEDVKLSNNFIENKGRLPWPTAKATISCAYGETIHAQTQGKNYNDGVTILTTQGSVARCVFDGTVSLILTDPNGYSVVIVGHGEFRTVYTNLEDVVVKKGSKIEAMQNIGKIHTDSRDGKTEIKFQIWKATMSQNPAIWLAPLR